MIPNIDKKFPEDNKDEILFQCECYGKHYLEVGFWKFKDDEEPQTLWFYFIDHTKTLLQAIKWWWKQKKCFMSEIELTKDDVKRLIKVLENFVK